MIIELDVASYATKGRNLAIFPENSSTGTIRFPPLRFSDIPYTVGR